MGESDSSPSSTSSSSSTKLTKGEKKEAKKLKKEIKKMMKNVDKAGKTNGKSAGSSSSGTSGGSTKKEGSMKEFMDKGKKGNIAADTKAKIKKAMKKIEAREKGGDNPNGFLVHKKKPKSQSADEDDGSMSYTRKADGQKKCPNCNKKGGSGGGGG